MASKALNAIRKLYPPAVAAELARRELARRHLADFVLFTYVGQYQMGWVHQELCSALEQFLQDVIDKKSPRLLVTMPPRHGKSELVSRRFPAWVFGNYPDMSFISSSYTADLACRMSSDVQRIMQDDPYRLLFKDTVIGGKGYKCTTELFEICGRKGVYRAAGVGGGITGMGADILNIDDPIKDRAQASSDAARGGIWDWYASTAYTRLSPGGGVLLTQTRWHEDDLAGKLIEKMKIGEGDTWTIINFPAIAERDEDHRKEGEALHPERYSIEQLNAIKTTIGSYEWSALYQQNPSPAEGALFKREWMMNRYNTVPRNITDIIQSWDCTFKDAENSDYVVGQVWGRCGGDFYLLDQVRARMDFPATIQAIKDLSSKWPRATAKLIEDKANGPAVISTLKRDIPGLIPINPEGGKLVRAQAVTPVFESGNVFLPANAPWIGDYIEEMCSFPTAKHDDQVDATSQAINRLLNHDDSVEVHGKDSYFR